MKKSELKQLIREVINEIDPASNSVHRTWDVREKSRKLILKLVGNKRGYDHIHFSINNGDPVDSAMGTISGPKSENDGKVELLGRASDGRHYTLWGPVTVAQYRQELSKV